MIAYGKEQTLDTKLGKLPEGLPKDLPPAHSIAAAAKDDKSPQTGIVSVKVPEISNACAVLVPDTYQTNVPHGLLIWCHSSGGIKDEELTANWDALCKKYNLIVMAPKSADPTKWQKSEMEFVRKVANEVTGKYNIDRTRVVIAGQEAGGAMAWLVGFQNRDLIRGIVAINAPVPAGVNPSPPDPVNRLAFLIAAPGKGQNADRFNVIAKRLRDIFYPVTLFDLGEASRSLEENERAEVVRWIDCLDRL